MKKIVIFGSSPEAVSVIENVRSQDQESEITLISVDGHYPYQPNLFASLMAAEISLEKVFCQTKKFYKTKKVEVILDKKITRINFKRKKVFMEDKSQIDFDEFYIADVPAYQFPDIQGIKKIGVYGLKSLKDIEQIINDLRLKETLVIQSISTADLSIAKALVQREKEVIFITQDVAVDKFLAIEGLQIIQDNTIVEILGEKEGRAIRLRTGKVLAADMVMFGNLTEDFKIFTNAALEVNKKICVNEEGRTNFDNVFSLGTACQVQENFALSNA